MTLEGGSGKGKPSLPSSRVLRRFRIEGRKSTVIFYLSDLSVSGENFSFQWHGIREEKWGESWKAHFKPIHAASRIVIRPPWEEYRGKKGEMIITIAPGMAFGTGTHPTTQMCLQALEELIPVFAHPPSVLDFGTGSGILAIAAEKLGPIESWPWTLIRWPCNAPGRMPR